MTDKIDRRKARTKQLLHGAILELLQEKSTDHITVTDVANRADVNRGTFYLHYKDVLDLFQQIKDETFDKIRNCIVQIHPNEVAQYSFKDDPHPKVVQLFEEMARNADYIRAILGPHGDLSYAIKIRKMMADHFIEKFNYLQPQDQKMLLPRDYLVTYISSATLGIIMHWLETNLEKTPYEMGLMLTQIANHGPIIASGLRDKPYK